MKHPEGKLSLSQTDTGLMVLLGEKKKYVASVTVKQIGGGAIAGAMEEGRVANANKLCHRWTSHADLLTACRDGIKHLDSCTSLESEKQDKAAMRRIFEQAIAKTEKKEGK